MSARSERRAILALVTVFALLVQALIPSLAMAASTSPGETTICTQQGLEATPAGEDTAPPAGHDCQHGVCPALSVTLPPFVSTRAVAYAVAEAPVTATPRGVRPLARAPPRPPGQGPPLSDA